MSYLKLHLLALTLVGFSSGWTLSNSMELPPNFNKVSLISRNFNVGLRIVSLENKGRRLEDDDDPFCVTAVAEGKFTDRETCEEVWRQRDMTDTTIVFLSSLGFLFVIGCSCLCVKVGSVCGLIKSVFVSCNCNKCVIQSCCP